MQSPPPPPPLPPTDRPTDRLTDRTNKLAAHATGKAPKFEANRAHRVFCKQRESEEGGRGWMDGRMEGVREGRTDRESSKEQIPAFCTRTTSGACAGTGGEAGMWQISYHQVHMQRHLIPRARAPS